MHHDYYLDKGGAWSLDVAKCIIWMRTGEHASSLDVAKCNMPAATREGRQELPLHNATRGDRGRGPGVTLRHQEDPWGGFSLIHDIHPHPTLGSGVAISHTRLILVIARWYG